MAVYRGDQAQLTFGVEAAQGGDPEMMEGTAGTGSTTINAAFEAGSRSITVASASNFTVGDMIRIGTVAGTPTQTVTAHEVRRLESIDGTTFLLDRPTAFYHASGQEVKEITAIGGNAGRNDDNKFITFLPGVYETVDTPDPEMSIEGRRFLGTQSKRNWSVAYPGQQTLTGSVSGMVLLNGIPLRFPIGSVVTTPSAKAGGSLTLAAAAKKGDIYVTASAGTGLAVGDYLNVDDGSTTKSEVRKLIANPTGNVWKLNAPLQFNHDSGASIDEVSANATYTHVINEAVDLDTVSWHVHMRDSSETAANDFDRRYVGGMIGSASLSAEEGGLVTMSWDGVNFLDMVHNQASQTDATSAGMYSGASVTGSMPRYALMQAIDSDDVGEPGLNNNTGYPTTEPYYFSNGSVSFYGQEVARMRSFSLSIANGEEPRYYIGRQGDRHRGPYEIREGAREYSLTTSLALPDTVSSTSSSQAGALELFKQLLLEGNYGGASAATARAGFTVTMTLQRGTDDKIIIDIPGSSTAGTPTAGAAKLNEQGVFINSAPHSLTTDNPFQVDADMIFRSLKITVQDSVPVYP